MTIFLYKVLTRLDRATYGAARGTFREGCARLPLLEQLNKIRPDLDLKGER
jgi:hypothetical protein